VVRLAAAEAYIDEVAERLDAGEEDLEVEGSIAKLFATEVADKAAGDAMQALGGYGYITEYGVEKVKRDVKIARVYEGTSEIQQNIISTFRWKKSRKTKGEFYGSLADQMGKLDAEVGDAGCRFYALISRILNEAITLAHENRLTRQQYVMFALADMMTYLEVGASLARKAVNADNHSSPEASKLKAMSRLFADETAQLTARNVLKIVWGTGVLDQGAAGQFMESIPYSELAQSAVNSIRDMDQVADFVFER
jgi:alkylation response protein AidB-like acyl-CoA dehydrogenase